MLRILCFYKFPLYQ